MSALKESVLYSPIDGVDQVLAIQPSPVNFMPTLRKVRIRFSDVPGEYLFDRMEIVSRSFPSSDLILEKATYRITNGKIMAQLELGAESDSIVKTLEEMVAKSQGVIDLVSKK